MARRKTDDTVGDFPPADSAAAESSAAPTPLPATSESEQQPQPPESTWAAKFGFWSDFEAGVRLVEERDNRRMTIQFGEKPSEAVRTLMKSEPYGFRFDAEDQLWYKRINPAKPRQVRIQAEELAFAVANLIRAEKGLPQRQSPSLAAG